MNNEETTIGLRIKQFRILEGYTQKQLAEKCELSESAIRNYELGIRTPDEETLHKIADALLINYYVLSNSGIDSEMEAIHILFDMEELYGLTPEIVDEEIVLKIKEPKACSQEDKERLTRLKMHLLNWAFIKNRQETEHLDSGDYFLWKSTYPAFNKKLSDSNGIIESYSNDNSPFDGKGTSDRNPIVKLHNTIVRALSLEGTDKAAKDNNTAKQKHPPKGLTREQILFYNKYHKERDTSEE